MRLALAFLISLIAEVRSANVIERLSVQDGAICDDRIPAYLVVDSHKLVGSENKLIFKDVDEPECKNMCTDNKDDQGNQMMCSSYTYNVKERSCTVYRGKASPVGKLELKMAQGHRYYEKFCLPEGTPADCGEKAFFRADQAVLIGFAKNVTHTKNLITCIQACIEMSAECRSAMFFGNAGECILSIASAQDAPDVFADEEDEQNVVYFENGCVVGNQIRPQKKHNAKEKIAEKKPSNKLSINATTGKVVNASSTVGDEDKKATPAPASSGEKKKGKKSDEEESGVIRNRKLASEEDNEEEEGAGAGAATTEEPESSTKTSRRGKPANGGKKVTLSAKIGGPKRLLLQNATNAAEEAWGPWSEECRSFDERRPCQNGNRVGFQSRQCLRTPFECQGPFFRYCIAVC